MPRAPAAPRRMIERIAALEAKTVELQERLDAAECLLRRLADYYRKLQEPAAETPAGGRRPADFQQ